MPYRDLAKQREVQRLWTRAKHAVRRRWLIKRMGGRCVVCGVDDERVLEFDHVGPKAFNIGNSFSFSLERLLDEARQCELVCANCHRIRTLERIGGEQNEMYCEYVERQGQRLAASTNLFIRVAPEDGDSPKGWSGQRRSHGNNSALHQNKEKD